ncbi:MAG: response regulator [Deinococcaceae bacterium]
MIEGQLRQFPLSELFILIYSGAKTGLLKVLCEGKESHVYFEDGQITYARILEGANLGEYLMRMELLSAIQVQQLINLQRKENPHTLLGLIAYRRKLIQEDQLLDALRAQISDTITELLQWSQSPQAHFTFEEVNGDASQVPTEHLFNPEQVLFEAAKRIDEWSLGQVEPWQVLRVRNTEQSLDIEEWELLSLVNGQRSNASIATEFDLPEGEVYRRLYKLIDKGAIEILPVQPEDPFILVISASSTIRRMCTVILTRARYRTITATTIQKGSEALQKAHISAAIVETNQPVPDAKLLRSIPGRHHLPIIVLSNEPANFWARLAKLKFLNKPLEEDQLLDSIGQVVRRPI